MKKDLESDLKKRERCLCLKQNLRLRPKPTSFSSRLRSLERWLPGEVKGNKSKPLRNLNKAQTVPKRKHLMRTATLPPSSLRKRRTSPMSLSNLLSLKLRSSPSTSLLWEALSMILRVTSRARKEASAAMPITLYCRSKWMWGRWSLTERNWRWLTSTDLS